MRRIPVIVAAGTGRKYAGGTSMQPDLNRFFDAACPALEPSAETAKQAQEEAEGGTPALQAQGYYVSIARRAASARRVPAASLSVLVVEDDPAFSMLLKSLLGLQGFQVHTATNRAGVLAGLTQTPPPDLVLLDVRLPDANGFDILLRMKQHPSLAAIPVIMLTGEATREAVTQGLAGGADGYVTKPFELESLVRAIRLVLGLS